VVGGLATFDGTTLSAEVDDVGGRMPPGEGGSNPPTLLDPCGGSSVFGDPGAAVADPGGQAIYVANHATDNVAIVPIASGSQPTFEIQVSAGPTGIAVTRDGSNLYVYGGFDHTLVGVSLVGGGSAVPTMGPLVLAQDVLPAQVLEGRRLFFSGTNPAITDPFGGVSCSSCHLEAREDGHIWKFADGLRQTPELAGRMLRETAPYHWNGTLATLPDFMNMTVQLRMGGFGLVPAQVDAIATFLETSAPPDNPFRGQPLSAQQVHGASLFASANCSTCHAGTAFTNNQFANVGTLNLSGPVPDQPATLPNGLNVPSLLNVGRSAPYLHDGSAASLQDRLLRDQAANQHGLTGGLSASDVDDLVSYLQTL
jgi:cytochrome c peroxidase